MKFDRSMQSDGEMVDRSGQPDVRNSSKTQIRTLLEEQRLTILAECREKINTNPKSHKYENFRVPPSMLLREENSSKIRTPYQIA